MPTPLFSSHESDCVSRVASTLVPFTQYTGLGPLAAFPIQACLDVTSRGPQCHLSLRSSAFSLTRVSPGVPFWPLSLTHGGIQVQVQVSACTGPVQALLHLQDKSAMLNCFMNFPSVHTPPVKSSTDAQFMTACGPELAEDFRTSVSDISSQLSTEQGLLPSLQGLVLSGVPRFGPQPHESARLCFYSSTRVASGTPSRPWALTRRGLGVLIQDPRCTEPPHTRRHHQVVTARPRGTSFTNHAEPASCPPCPASPGASDTAHLSNLSTHPCTNTGSLPPLAHFENKFANCMTARASKFLHVVQAYFSSCQDCARIPATFQVGNVLLGSMRLPGQVTPLLLEKCWRFACASTGAWPNARIYSGPFPLEFSTPLELQMHRLFCKRSVGHVITVVPEVRGGGNKDDNYQLAVSKLASTCLERGIPVERASTAAQALVKGAGAKACLQAHQSGDTRSVWTSLQGLAKAHSVEWPEADNRTERAAKRIQ